MSQKLYGFLGVSCKCSKSWRQRRSLLPCLRIRIRQAWAAGKTPGYTNSLQSSLSAERRKHQLSEMYSAAPQYCDPLSSCPCAVTEPHHSQRMDFELLWHKGFEMTSLISACCTSLPCRSKHLEKQINSVIGLKDEYCSLTLTLASVQLCLWKHIAELEMTFLNVFCTCGGQWYKPLANQLF